MPKVPESYKEEKRQVLLESALHCFAERGFQATTIDEIVRHAGVSKGMLYTYFPSKEDIYLQLLAERNDINLERVGGMFADCPTAAAKIRLLMQRFRDFPQNPDFRRYTAVHLEFLMHATREPRLADIMKQRYDRYVNFLVKVIEEGKQSGEFPSTLDSGTLSTLFWAMRDGVMLHFAHVGNAQAYQKVCVMLEDMLYRYLGITAER